MTTAQQQISTTASRVQGQPLTPRELEIAGLVAQALTDRQIAYKLHVSPFTVVSTLIMSSGSWAFLTAWLSAGGGFLIALPE
jgi:FixJ family two-component response regulator